MDDKPSKASGSYRPFSHLKSLLDNQAFPLTPPGHEKPRQEIRGKKGASVELDEGRLFEQAMADVVPMDKDPVLADVTVKRPPRTFGHDQEAAEALARLEDLIRGGAGFVVSDTPEYMEGIGYGVNPEVARRLHHGDFSIQDHLDLHGLTVEDAQDAFEGFFKKALVAGNRAVLVIHGRGLSSRSEPVLKAKVKQWLTSGPWRKWVIAFTSARSCDGGAGATYVLLRQRPVTKKQRRDNHRK